jgi:ribA/ribD-fused uncharacterized protein
MISVTRAKLFACLLVFPFAQVALGAALEAPAGSRSWYNKKDALYFYDRNKPYYEFTNFFDMRGHQLNDRGVQWPSTEHYFQAQKFIYPNGVYNRNCYEAIRQANSPRQAFEIARVFKQSIRPDWCVRDRTGLQIRQQVMLEGLYLKFQQNADLKKLLLDTGDKVLVEDSPIDDLWGRGSNWQGNNELGQMLMAVRYYIRNNRWPQVLLPGAIAYPDQPSLVSRCKGYLSTVGKAFMNKFVSPVKCLVAAALTGAKRILWFKKMRPI